MQPTAKLALLAVLFVSCADDQPQPAPATAAAALAEMRRTGRSDLAQFGFDC